MTSYAQLAFYTYAFMVWPLGAVVSGMSGHSLVWAAIGAAPIALYVYLDDRRAQRLKDEPASITNSLVVVLLVFVPLTMCLHYLGRLIGWLLG